MKRYLIFFLVSATILLMSCNGFRMGRGADGDVADSLHADSLKADSLEEEDFSDVVVPKAADELFDDFIFNFAGNKKVQLERIVFPLTVTEGDKVTKMERKDWKVEYFFMRQGYYTLLFNSEKDMEIVKDTSVTHAVVEKIHFGHQTIRQYVFNRIRGTWMMTAVNEKPLSESPDASFLEFYHQFAADMAFQSKHLESTVKFIGPDPDDDFSQMEGIISPDTWEAFAPQIPSKTLYNIVYGRPEQGGKVKHYVLRGIANGLELEMTFRKHGHVWKLSKLIT